MSIYDVVMLAILGGAVFFGFWKGLAWQIASLTAIIVSYVVAVNFREPVARFIQTDAPWDKIGAMLILFVGTSLAIWIIYGRVSATIKKMELKGFDRQAGALLGGVKGILLCMVVTMLSVSWLGEKAHDTIHNSKLGPYIVSGIGTLSAIVPAEIAQIIDPHVDDFEKAIGHDADLAPESYPQGSRYPVGGGLFQNNNNQGENGNTPRQPIFRGRLKWNTSTSDETQAKYQNQQAQWVQPDVPGANANGINTRFSNSNVASQPAPNETSDRWTKIKSYSEGVAESASDEFFKRVANAAKRAFDDPPHRKK